MRKVVLGLGISLDGYIARKNGSVDWLSVDWEYDWGAFMSTIDTVLMGRRSWEKLVELGGGENANPYKGLSTYVFSKTIEAVDTPDVTVVEKDVAGFVSDLRKRDGKDIWLTGGGDLAASFFEADLVDELYLGVTPILLGSGIPLFEGFQRDVPLRLMRNNTCFNKARDNAMVELVYEVVRPG